MFSALCTTPQHRGLWPKFVTFLNFLRKTLGKEQEQDVSEHCQNLHRGPRRYCQTVQAPVAEEAAHHVWALKAVWSVERGTKTVVADLLRGFLLLELSSVSPRRATDTLTSRRLFEALGEATFAQTEFSQVALRKKTI